MSQDDEQGCAVLTLLGCCGLSALFVVFIIATIAKVWL